MSRWVVTVTPTIMSGTVVRWFSSVTEAQSGVAIISASREGVIGHGGGNIDPDLFQQAWTAHDRLSRNDRVDVRELATHRRASLRGPFIAVTR